MIKIEKETWFKVKKNVTFKEGEFASFTTEKNKLVVDKSDGVLIAGPVIKIKSSKKGTKVKLGLAQNIYMSTDVFEKDKTYAINANLYVSQGVITTANKKINDVFPNQCVGIVIDPPAKGKPSLTFFKR